MKVKYKVNPKCELEVELKDVVQSFQFIAYAQSVFANDECGKCGSDRLRLLHRSPKGYDYYSVQCLDCKYELKFGQQKESKQLFAKGWEPPYEGNGSKSSSKSSRNEEYDDVGYEDADAEEIAF